MECEIKDVKYNGFKEVSIFHVLMKELYKATTLHSKFRREIRFN